MKKYTKKVGKEAASDVLEGFEGGFFFGVMFFVGVSIVGFPYVVCFFLGRFFANLFYPISDSELEDD